MARSRWVFRRQCGDGRFLVGPPATPHQSSTHLSLPSFVSDAPHVPSALAYRAHGCCVVRSGAFSKLITLKESWPEHPPPP